MPSKTYWMLKLPVMTTTGDALLRLYSSVKLQSNRHLSTYISAPLASNSEEEEEEEDEVSGAEDDIPLDLPIPTHVLHADKRKRCDVSRISVEDSVADDDDDGADGVTLKKHREMAERNLKEESETGGAPPNFR